MALRIWVASVDDLHLRPSQEVFSSAELERADRTRSPLLRQRFLGRRWMARALLAEATGGDPGEVILEKTCERCGDLHPASPLAGSSEELWWSASSSAGLAAVAISAHRVGIDIESKDDRPHWERIAKRFYGEAERRAVAGSPARFLEFWTVKEAFLKALGLGLAGGLRSIDCSRLCDGAEWRTSTEHPGWRFRSISPGPGFVGAVAVEGAPDRIELQCWKPTSDN